MLTVLAHHFPAGERRGPGAGGCGRPARRAPTPPVPAAPHSRRAGAHLSGREARRRAVATRGRDHAALRAQGLQAGGAEAGAGEGAGGAGRRAGTPARKARPHQVPTPVPQASDELLREHYARLRERPFYGRLVDYMHSGPMVAMERDPRQRLRGERPSRDRALVPQR
uniref:nucleoside diphosphate kinase 3 isoform X1 n=1 Tax=Nyctereutes procyonoides TaxID=34880 RepID=UPI002443A590|nr:nucleoside diphosphate kinase 3 isoform X1 [Nyctereutes procyonoides]